MNDERRLRDPAVRFTGRVESYARFRPDYPAALIPYLVEHGSLNPGDIVADLGSGTGRLTERFLDAGHQVLAVEPNDEMRAAGEALLSGRSGFTSVAGRAEATGLPDASVDVVAAGQAFHWFDPEPTRRELSRILRPGGRVILVWNDRNSRAGGLMAGYESLLRRFGTDYHQVRRKGADEKEVEAFFGPAGCRRTVLPHAQELDLEGLRGRLLSSSYVPEAGETGFDAMIRALEELFHRHQEKGRVKLIYDTRVYHGTLEGRRP